jgi:hypothetical protein
MSAERRRSLIAELTPVIINALVDDPGLLANAIIEGRVGLEEMSDAALIELGAAWHIEVEW